MQKRLLVLFCIVLWAGPSTAQTFFLNGYFRDSLTRLPVSGATLSNNTKGQKQTADGNGFFRLPVSPDDLLYALAPGYHFDTLRYSVLFRDTITVLLSPVDVLEAVTIETGYRRYQADSLRRRQEFEEERGNRVTAIDQSKQKQTFGLTLNLDRLFKKEYKNKKEEEKLFADLEREAYIRFRYSPQIVAFYTGLRGDALLAFMRQNTPSYKWLRSHPNREQLVDYLSEKMKVYRRSQ